MFYYTGYSSEWILLNNAEAKQLIVQRLNHIQRLAKQKRFSEIESLLNRKYV